MIFYIIIIFLLKLTTKLVVEIRPEKNQARTGFQPMTSVIPVQRSTNWAYKPTGSWSLCWIQINLQALFQILVQ